MEVKKEKMKLNKESEAIVIITAILAIAVFVMIGTASADDKQAGGGTAAEGINVTLNSTSATGIWALDNTTPGANITVSFNTTNLSAPFWWINASDYTVSINGSGYFSTIETNGTFTLNSSHPTDFFSVMVRNAENYSEVTNLTGFKFVDPTAINTSANTTVTYNNETNPTLVPTYVYYFFNGSYINISVATIAKMDNVTADYSSVDGGLGFNSTGANMTGIWYYNLTNVTAPSAANTTVNLISINLTFNGLTYTVTPSFYALMNFNPKYIDTTLGGNTTDWSTDIADFTNVSNLTFEKVVGGNSIGKLEFIEALNLTDTDTATGLQSLGTNLNIAAATMELNITALVSMNKSSRLYMYNLTQFSNSPGILRNGVPIVQSGEESGGTVQSLEWNGTSQTLIFNVTSWSNYTADGAPPTVTSVSPTDGATGVAISTMISATFNETMNTTSVESAFSISGGTLGSFVWTADNKTFTRSASLSYSTTYTITINANIAKDLAGNLLDGNANGTADGSPIDDYSWSFTTESAPAAAAPLIGGAAAPAAPAGETTVSTEPTGEVKSTVTATSTDAKASVVIAKGIIARDAANNPLTEATVTQPSALPAGVPSGVNYVGYAYDFGPASATFSQPVEISITFDPAQFEGKTPVIYVYEAGTWKALDTTVVGNKATAKVTHFSTFVLFAALPIAPTPTPVPTVTPAVTPTPTPTPSPSPTPKQPGFEAVIAIAGLLAVAYLLLRRK
jgi:PGF-CTERM protein